MKVGDSVMVYSTAVCYAPVESIGMAGVIVEDISGGIYPAGRYMVRFVESVAGYSSWIYDEMELLLDDSPLLFGDDKSRLTPIVRRLYSEGLSKSEIGRRLGISRDSVYAHLAYS